TQLTTVEVTSIWFWILRMAWPHKCWWLFEIFIGSGKYMKLISETNNLQILNSDDVRVTWMCVHKRVDSRESFPMVQEGSHQEGHKRAELEGRPVELQVEAGGHQVELHKHHIEEVGSHQEE